MQRVSHEQEPCRGRAGLLRCRWVPYLNVFILDIGRWQKLHRFPLKQNLCPDVSHGFQSRADSSASGIGPAIPVYARLPWLRKCPKPQDVSQQVGTRPKTNDLSTRASGPCLVSSVLCPVSSPSSGVECVRANPPLVSPANITKANTKSAWPGPVQIEADDGEKMNVEEKGKK